ncbi:UNVERIFIED_ORG: DNA-binding transcriptional LysR family regulator [Rhizobium nepotum]|nr:DNA-binding transcriptional LysR family regulator [Rhizobium nepotum]
MKKRFKYCRNSTRWGLRQIADQIFASQGTHRTTTFEVDEFSLLLQFVERGFGLAMVPRALIANHRLAALDVTPQNRNFTVWDSACIPPSREMDFPQTRSHRCFETLRGGP